MDIRTPTIPFYPFTKALMKTIMLAAAIYHKWFHPQNWNSLRAAHNEVLKNNILTSVHPNFWQEDALQEKILLSLACRVLLQIVSRIYFHTPKAQPFCHPCLSCHRNIFAISWLNPNVKVKYPTDNVGGFIDSSKHGHHKDSMHVYFPFLSL